MDDIYWDVTYSLIHDPRLRLLGIKLGHVAQRRKFAPVKCTTKIRSGKFSSKLLPIKLFKWRGKLHLRKHKKRSTLVSHSQVLLTCPPPLRIHIHVTPEWPAISRWAAPLLAGCWTLMCRRPLARPSRVWLIKNKNKKRHRYPVFLAAGLSRSPVRGLLQRIHLYSKMHVWGYLHSKGYELMFVRFYLFVCGKGNSKRAMNEGGKSNTNSQTKLARKDISFGCRASWYSSLERTCVAGWRTWKWIRDLIWIYNDLWIDMHPKRFVVGCVLKTDTWININLRRYKKC